MDSIHTKKFESAVWFVSMTPIWSQNYHTLIPKIYLDDILICSDDPVEHEKLVKEVIRRLNEANLRLNIDKCLFGVKEIDFLGFKISQNGIEIDPDRQRRFLDLPLPVTGKHLQSQLGMFNFVRDFLPTYGDIAAPLYSLTKVGVLADDPLWVEKGFEAYKKVIALIRSPTLLKYECVPLHLKTDASETGFGGYLFQLDPETMEQRIIHMFSGSFKGSQFNYSIPKKELFATF